MMRTSTSIFMAVSLSLATASSNVNGVQLGAANNKRNQKKLKLSKAQGMKKISEIFDLTDSADSVISTDVGSSGSNRSATNSSPRSDNESSQSESEVVSSETFEFPEDELLPLPSSTIHSNTWGQWGMPIVEDEATTDYTKDPEYDDNSIRLNKFMKKAERMVNQSVHGDGYMTYGDDGTSMIDSEMSSSRHTLIIGAGPVSLYIAGKILENTNNNSQESVNHTVTIWEKRNGADPKRGAFVREQVLYINAKQWKNEFTIRQRKHLLNYACFMNMNNVKMDSKTGSTIFGNCIDKTDLFNNFMVDPSTYDVPNLHISDPDNQLLVTISISSLQIGLLEAALEFNNGPNTNTNTNRFNIIYNVNEFLADKMYQEQADKFDHVLFGAGAGATLPRSLAEEFTPEDESVDSNYEKRFGAYKVPNLEQLQSWCKEGEEGSDSCYDHGAFTLGWGETLSRTEANDLKRKQHEESDSESESETVTKVAFKNYERRMLAIDNKSNSTARFNFFKNTMGASQVELQESGPKKNFNQRFYLSFVGPKSAASATENVKRGRAAEIGASKYHLKDFTLDTKKNIVSFPLTPSVPKQFYRLRYTNDSKVPKMKFFSLIGDQITKHHFFSGNGVNSGFKTGNYLAKFLSSPIRSTKLLKDFHKSAFETVFLANARGRMFVRQGAEHSLLFRQANKDINLFKIAMNDNEREELKDLEKKLEVLRGLLKGSPLKILGNDEKKGLEKLISSLEIEEMNATEKGKKRCYESSRF